MITYLLFISLSVCQTFNGWDSLSKIKIDSQFDEILNESIEVPVFSDELRAFEGKIVSVEGFVIPLKSSPEQNFFVLSRFPYASCFFCGNAGPETVAEVYVKEPVRPGDEKIKVTGRLKLNSQDPFHLFYILENAEVE